MLDTMASIVPMLEEGKAREVLEACWAGVTSYYYPPSIIASVLKTIKMLEETLNAQVWGSAESVGQKLVRLAVATDDELVKTLTYSNFVDEAHSKFFLLVSCIHVSVLRPCNAS
jgi:hypothetical protein